ncbi:Cytochrome P450 2 sub R member 1 [Chamberlinius hualienensis]
MAFVDVWTLFSCVLAVVFVRWLFKTLHLIRQMPPGPWGLPLIGYTPWLGKEVYKSFSDIAKVYGGLFSVNVAGETVVIFNDWATVKATLVEKPKTFSGRRYMAISNEILHRKNITAGDGKAWKVQRILTIQCLRNIGILKKSMEHHIVDLAQEVIENLNKTPNSKVPMESVFFRSIVRANWKLVSVTHISDEDLNEYELAVRELFKQFRFDNLLHFFYWLRYIPPDGFGYKPIMKASNYVLNQLRIIIDQHLNDWVEGNDKDLIDLYISEMKKHEIDGKLVKEPFTVNHLLGTLWDLFMAGVDTTNSTLLWAFLHLAYNPEVQRKAQNELDSVVGRYRQPSLDDYLNLPYLEAVIMEIHRMTSIVPLAIPHRTIEDAKVFGYNIPANTTCVQNIYAIHHDPNLWEEPELFKPERFIDKNNKTIWPPYLMPFSIGPRACIGQNLAQMELKIIISSLLHQFNFYLPPGEPKPSLEADKGLTLQPFPYSLLIETRNE